MKNILLLCSILFMFSCSSENIETDKKTENKLLSVKDFYNLINTKTKHRLFIKNNTSWYTPNNLSVMNGTSQEKNLGLSIKIDGKQYDPIDFNTNTDNRTSWALENADFNDIYGKTVRISFSTNKFNSITGSSIPLQTNVYLPKIIKINFSNLSSDNKVIIGTVVTWNLDSDNGNKVILSLEYEPKDQSEDIERAYPEKIFYAKTADDNGSYTITAEDLNLYPDNASLTFCIGRANVNVINDGNLTNKLSVITYNENRTGFKIEKQKY